MSMNNAGYCIMNSVWRGQVPAAAGFRGGAGGILEHAPPREQPTTLTTYTNDRQTTLNNAMLLINTTKIHFNR